ncbi:MAG TPA: hypothetical protein VFE60_19540 [Roseiarcus sp.]|nr:hypothetical protein [Roseiarcus sp.]
MPDFDDDLAAPRKRVAAISMLLAQQAFRFDRDVRDLKRALDAQGGALRNLKSAYERDRDLTLRRAAELDARLAATDAAVLAIVEKVEAKSGSKARLEQ